MSPEIISRPGTGYWSGPAVTPAGKVHSIRVSTPDKGWHGYWKNPGDAGVETRIEWTLPAGVTAGPLQYPVPGRLMISGLMNYVYEGRYAQLVALKLPEGLAEGTRLPLRAKLDYLACTDEICVPERAEVALDLNVGAKGATPAGMASPVSSGNRMPKIRLASVRSNRSVSE